MKTTPIPAAATHFRQFAVHFQYLMITLVVLSIGLLCLLAHSRNANATTQGHLKSSWFHSSTDSRGATDWACLGSAARLFAPGTPGAWKASKGLHPENEMFSRFNGI